MRAVVQRVREARVTIAGETSGGIGEGLLVFLGVGKGDSRGEADYLVEKIINLRIFEDEEGRMNLSALELKKELLIVSQFTLLGDCRKGRRPSFFAAAEPRDARELYDYFVNRAAGSGLTVETGEFQAMMDVSLVNDGPVTLLLDSNKEF